MWYTPCLSQNDFIVGVTSVRFGQRFDNSQELLQFSDEQDDRYLPAIMDSGTSCLVVPGDRLGGKLTNVPFNDFTSQWEEGKSFWLEIGGRQWRVPFSSWFLARTNQTCVQPSPAGMQGLLIGDVFFRSYMVEFDMTQRDKPIIGIAPLNTAYRPVPQPELGTFELHHAPMGKLQLLRGEETMFPAEHTQRLTQVDQIPIFNKKGTQYFMDVGVGTPRQPFTVIFDTGSAVFGVFVVKHDLPMSIRAQLPDSIIDGGDNPLLLEQASVRVVAASPLDRLLGTDGTGRGVAGLAVALVGLNVHGAPPAQRRCWRRGAAAAQDGGGHQRLIGATATAPTLGCAPPRSAAPQRMPCAISAPRVQCMNAKGCGTGMCLVLGGGCWPNTFALTPANGRRGETKMLSRPGAAPAGDRGAARTSRAAAAAAAAGLHARTRGLGRRNREGGLRPWPCRCGRRCGRSSGAGCAGRAGQARCV